MEKKIYSPYPGIEKLQLKIPGNYTVIHCPFGKTQLMEISIFNRHSVWPYFKTTAQKENTYCLPISLKENGRPLTIADVSTNWMLFAGHGLPLRVDSRFQVICNPIPFRFIHNDPQALKSFIESKCINLSVTLISKVGCCSDSTENNKSEVLLPPERRLWSSDLFFETELFPGIYFAITDQGHGVIHDRESCLGSAYPYDLGAYNYRVHIHSEHLCPGPDFSRYHYTSQEKAIEALIYHTTKLYQRSKYKKKNRC